MKSARLIIRNTIFIIVGLVALLFPESSGIVLRIYAAYTLYSSAFTLYRLRASLRYIFTHIRSLLLSATPLVLRIVVGVLLLISPAANLSIAALMLGIEIALSSINRYSLMLYHRSSMSTPAFVIRLVAATLTAVSGVFAVISRSHLALALAILVSGCEWIIGLLSSPAVVARISNLIPHIEIKLPRINLPRINLPKINLPKRKPRPAKPAKPVDTYRVPQEFIYTDGFADKSVD